MAKRTEVPGGKPHAQIGMKMRDGNIFICPECGATAEAGFFGSLQEDATCTGTETIIGSIGH